MATPPRQLDLSTQGLASGKTTQKSIASWIDFLLTLWDGGVRTALELVGEAGYAKTSFVKAYLRSKNIRPVVISLAQVDWDSFFAPYPEQGEDGARKVTMLLHEDLLNDDPKVLVFDESRRAGKREQNILLEVKASGTLAGVPIPNLRGVICLDNPGGSGSYAGVAGMDPAQGDRGFHVEVGINDIDWKGWFETTFPSISAETWKAVWRWHTALDVAQRRVMHPRNLEHMVRLGMAGFPVVLGLPVLASGREKVLNARDEDTTDTVIDGFCRAFGFANLPADAADVVALVDWSILNGQNVRIIGPHGRGKTAYISARIAELSDQFEARHGEPLELEAFSAPLVSPQDLALLGPGPNGTLRHLVADRFVRPGRRYALLIDEFSRADRRIAAANMALVQEGEIAGQALDGLQCVIALDNPTEYRGMRFDAGRIDRAQASRFTATVVIDDTDLPWRAYFDKKYGNEAQPVIDWWFEDLDEAGKAVVTFRTLERLVLAAKHRMPLKAALGVIGHDQVEVPLADLERRLSKVEVIGLGKILANATDYVEAIRNGDEDLASTVKDVFAVADLVQLDKNEAIVKEYIRVLPKDLCGALVRTKEATRQAFWAKVLTVRLAK